MRPVAEGITGSAPLPRETEGGICRSLLMELCEGGQQMVKVTHVHKKFTELMYPEPSAGPGFLDDYVSPPAPSDTFVAWASRYLVLKLE